MHWEELEAINCARGRDEVFPHKTVVMPAVNLSGAEFTSRISTLPLQAGIGSSGTRGLRRCILGRTKGNNFNTTLSNPEQAQLSLVKMLLLWPRGVSICSYLIQRSFWSRWFGCQCWCSWHRRKGGWMQQKLCLICITLNHKSSKRENRREAKCLILDSDFL